MVSIPGLIFCFDVSGRDGAIPGQSHIARGGLARWGVNISCIYASFFVFSLHFDETVSVIVSIFLSTSRGNYMNTGTSQSLSGALNRQNQLMQGSGLQGGAFGRRYWCPSDNSGTVKEVVWGWMWPSCFVHFSFFLNQEFFFDTIPINFFDGVLYFSFFLLCAHCSNLLPCIYIQSNLPC